MTVEIAPGPAMSGIPIGTIAGSAREEPGARSSGSSCWSVDMPMIVKRMPPAI
jgi:hypothetical protein